MVAEGNKGTVEATGINNLLFMLGLSSGMYSRGNKKVDKLNKSRNILYLSLKKMLEMVQKMYLSLFCNTLGENLYKKIQIRISPIAS